MTFLAPNTTPGTYEFQVLDLLHDPNAAKWSTVQIDQYVNEARRQLCMDMGCLRSLQQSYITAGVEQYTFGQVTGATILTAGANYSGPSVAFSGGGGTGVAATLSQSGGAVNAIAFSNYGSGYSSAPTAVVSDSGAGAGATIGVGIINLYTYDILGVSAYQGNERYALTWWPFRAFSARYRPFTPSSYQRQPAAWAVYGDNTVFIGPVPDQTYAVEFDTVILSTPFAAGDTTTPDAIPAKSQDPIKFYAAYLAKFNAQSYGEAEKWLEQYQRRCRDITSSYVGRLPDPYEDQ